MPCRASEFQSIRSEGGLLPPDLLRKIIVPQSKLEGLRSEDYGLPRGERINEVVTQSWNRLKKHWAEFRSAISSLPENEAATGLTNDKWSLPLLRELGFGLLPATPGPELAGRTYPISRFFGPLPIHLIGCGISLDRRAAGIRGAAAGNPHGLVQEFLNRSSDHLWAVVSNGLRFRLLRDNQALSRQSFLEFDLESMFDGELYADFVLLWLLAHATRFAPRDSSRPESCWIEAWTRVAAEEGTRALESLKGGVEKALQVLGQGFVSHPKNGALREALRAGTLPPNILHAELLRIVYRLIFLFVTEDRELEGIPLLHPQKRDDTSRLARDRYARHYSVARLREMASKIKGSRHGDLWQQFQILVGALSGEEKFSAVRESLALPELGSFLWNADSTRHLNGPGLGEPGVELTNYDFLETLRNLALTRQGRVLRPVDYKNLGSEEFGGVYESLLALTPRVGSNGAQFTFAELAGNERKTSGSYYTPDSLVQCLLDSALDPVVQDRLVGKSGTEAEKALLGIRVCDPAVGSGHFLVGAAHRLARHLARVRAYSTGESEPSPLLYQHALRDVISHCLYGVDINPMAVELCKVTLWLEAVEPGKPLSFLDHHIRCGNSLLGTTPDLVAAGLPDNAFKPITDDDKTACSELKKLNRRERSGFGELFAREDSGIMETLRDAAGAVDKLSDDNSEAIHQKEEAFRKVRLSYGYLQRKQLFDTWCAAFVIKKRMENDDPFGITQRHVNNIAADQALSPELAEEAKRLAKEYQFFHWHLEFPEVFGTVGGFDVILGNPPWDMVELSEKEYFAERAPDIATATSARKRQALIERLQLERPALFKAFSDSKRVIQGMRHFIQNSGMLPLGSTGRINLYPLFTEAAVNLMSKEGRLGIIVPSAIAMDAYNASLFRSVLDRNLLVSLFDFENSGTLFPSVHRSYRFCLLTLGSSLETIQLCYFAHDVAELNDPERRIKLPAQALAIFSPNTFAPPILQRTQDKEIALRIYSRFGVFLNRQKGSRNPWQPSIQRMLSLSDEGDFFRRADELSVAELSTVSQWRRLYSGKVIHSFNHRFATFSGDWRDSVTDELRDATFVVQTEYYARVKEVEKRTQGKFPTGWLLGFRDISRATDERTAIAAIIPDVGCDTHCRNIYFDNRQPILVALLLGNLNSFCFDFFARQKVIGTGIGATILEQLPVLPPVTYATSCTWADEMLSDWLLKRVLELTYTAWDLEPFARDCGWFGPPFAWDEVRRFQIRCELDAAFFHLYGLSHEDAAYILDTFPIVRRKDEAAHGTYRTKDTILTLYNEMVFTQHSNGGPFISKLDPPPAAFRAAHPWSWRDLPLELPQEPRVAFTNPNFYAQTVILEMLWQSGGALSFPRLRQSVRLLTQRRRTELATQAEYLFGTDAKRWERNAPDFFPNDQLRSILEGYYQTGTLAAQMDVAHYIVTFADPTKYEHFAHVRVDARIALAVAATLPPDPEPIPPEDSKLLQTMIRR